jgi:hypothetical protein
MGLSLELKILVFFGLIPATISLVVSMAIQRLLPESAAGRYAGAVGLGSGLVVAMMLPPVSAFQFPLRHWQWLAPLSMAAAVVGPLSIAAGVRRARPWVLWTLLAIAAALLLTPSWPRLAAGRTAIIAGLAIYFLLLIILLDTLTSRIPATVFPWSLPLTSLWVAGLGGYFVSVTYACIAMAATAAMTAESWATFRRGNNDWLRGMIAPFVITAGGTAFVMCIAPEPPYFELLIVAASPLVLWTSILGPARKGRGLAHVAAQGALLLLVYIAAAAWLYFRVS